MPYIGTPPNDRVLTSEDIKDGAIEIKDISWKNEPANENISGTIDSFTVKLAEQFTLTGDIDISKDLVLTKLADDGEALVLTTDASSRTIEGSGTISSNTFAQVPNASVTGMTGVLGSGVTGGSGINALGTVTSGTIGSADNFPQGSCIQVVQGTTSTEVSITDSSNFVTTGLSVSITPKQANSNFRIDFNMPSYVGSNGRSFYNIHSSKKSGNGLLIGTSHGSGSSGDGQQQATIHWLDDPTYSLGESITYTLYAKAFNSVNIQLLNSTNETAVGLVTEIAG